MNRHAGAGAGATPPNGNLTPQATRVGYMPRGAMRLDTTLADITNAFANAPE